VRTTRRLVITGLMVFAVATAAFAQRFLLGDGTGYEPTTKNLPYDGRFTFARIKYTGLGPLSYYYRGLPAWAHGYIPDPRRGNARAENNLMKIMDEVTYLHPHTDGSVVYGFDDPNLFRFPVAYMTEPGFWTMNDKEAAGFRAYLQKGGFLILDDFRHDGDRIPWGGGWDNVEGNVRRAIPGAQLLPMDPSMMVYDSFFKIGSFDIVPQAYDREKPEFFGLFEDNDPKKRLMMIVNYSTDISDFWEFSATGFRPIDESNEAYKLGVNYIMYGITH
jgi:hypothetical protein